ncbi:MAG: hypothetical protein AUH44_02080 [Chloroflexi bacterium 13_1_40CM_68_15]|nr:MAG: hypothetical protein AUH44_02080 [Chloroflexi bacterium 13_1_40CM_68_15]
MTRALLWLSLALVAFRVLSAAFVVIQPGFTDAYYYVDVARRLAHGQGLTADFVWNFIEAPQLAPLPVPSHRFWMPLTTVVQAAGIATLEPLLGAFRSAQAAIIAVAAFIPAATYAAARSVGATPRAALAGAALAGIGGGAFAPAWVTLDSFAIAALAGTCFFIAFAQAADGGVRAGAFAGALVGLLFLARAEGSLFGVALLALAARPVSRRAGIAGALIALAVGLGWLARGQLLGGSPDLLARSALLARYEDFFAIQPTGAADLATIAMTRVGALWSDLVVAVFGLLVFLAFPLYLGLRAAWRLPAVRAFAGLALLIYVAEGVIWPLHATRGSYFHSLAAFYPFAMALVAVGGEAWLNQRDAAMRRLAVTGTLFAAAGLAVFGLLTWNTAFNAPYRARLAALDAIPAGPFLAIDAACVAARYGASSVVVEPAHFSTYDGLFRGLGPQVFEPAIDRGGILIFPMPARVICGFDQQ